MFKIDYNFSKISFTDIETITEDDLRYNFLPGDVVFKSNDIIIDMTWGWIPLLDFSYCLYEILKLLAIEHNSIKYFEFTESAETIEFSRDGVNLKIIPSFSLNKIEVTFDEFNHEVIKFRSNINLYLKKELINRTVSDSLDKYLNDF